MIPFAHRLHYSYTSRTPRPASCLRAFHFHGVCYSTTSKRNPSSSNIGSNITATTTKHIRVKEKEDLTGPKSQVPSEDNDDQFNYTRGRFVMDEKTEMSRRRVQFDAEELARIAAAAVSAEHCVSIKKFPDGMYNKALLLTMNDGTEAVAKIPNPNVGYRHLTTASEVATMEFV